MARFIFHGDDIELRRDDVELGFLEGYAITTGESNTSDIQGRDRSVDHWFKHMTVTAKLKRANFPEFPQEFAVPQTAEVGDLLVMFMESPMLFVVRKQQTSSGTKNEFRFIVMATVNNTAWRTWPGLSKYPDCILQMNRSFLEYLG